MMGPYTYVVAALVFLASIIGAHEYGYHRASKVCDAQIQSIRAELETKVAQAQKLAAETSERVVIRYKDRVQIIHETAPEVEHDVQVIRKSDFTLPAEFVRLHNAGAGVPSETPAGTDESTETVSCADAIETIRANYEASRENSAQLEALQEWARALANP